KYVESLEAGLFGRRLDRRRTGRGDRGHRAYRSRLRHWRLDSDSGELVRRRRLEAIAYARVARPCDGRKRLGVIDEFRADQDSPRRGGNARLCGGPPAGRSVRHSQARGTLRLAREETGAEA